MVSTREIEQIGLLGEQYWGSFGRDPEGLIKLEVEHWHQAEE